MIGGLGTARIAAVVGGGAMAGTLVTLALGAILSMAGKRRRWRRAGTAMAWSATSLALAAAGIVASSGSFGIGWQAGRSGVLDGLWVDPLTVSLLVLVCGVGALVQTFGARYLAADQRSHRFAALTNLVVLAMVVVSTSATLTVFVAAWVAAGAGFVAAVAYRSDIPGASACARRTLATFAVGDAGLVVALALVWDRVGNLQIAGPAPARVGALGALGPLVALLAVVAALARSGQGPFGRWLPGTVSAPTPVSALLHAGVVNGAGILLVRLGTLTGSQRPAMVLAFVVAVATVPFAATAMARRADVKGHLVFSTAGQMAFMVAECAVGASVAALVHLAGHAVYKATLFLGSGSQVRRQGADVLAGDQGAAVPAGDQGAAVPAGDQGAAVPAGDQGAAVPAGDRGAAVPAGDRGAAMPAGSPGDDRPGIGRQIAAFRLAARRVASPSGRMLAAASAGRVLAAAAAALVATGAVAAVPGSLAHRGGPVLLVFVAVAPAAAAWSGWTARPRSTRHAALASGLLAAALLAAASAVYGLLLAAAGSWISASTPAAGAGVISPWWLLVVPAAAVAPRALARWPHLERRVTAAVLHAGALPATAMARPRPGWGPGVAAPLTAPGVAAGVSGDDVERAA